MALLGSGVPRHARRCRACRGRRRALRRRSRTPPPAVEPRRATQRPPPNRRPDDRTADQRRPRADPRADARTARTGDPARAAGKIFADKRILVAYYGTANTGALGVLGETSPTGWCAGCARPRRRSRGRTAGPDRLRADRHDRGRDAGQGRRLQPRHRPGRRRALHRGRPRARGAAAARHPARPVRLPLRRDAAGRGRCEDPYVGLALDPEWRMGRRGVPGQRIGSVARRRGQPDLGVAPGPGRPIEQLPQKLFVLHQFRSDMIEDIERIEPRRGLVMVQHVDGFGTPWPEARHLQRGRPAGAVRDGPQAVLRRGHPRFTRPASVRGDPAAAVQFVSYQ